MRIRHSFTYLAVAATLCGLPAAQAAPARDAMIEGARLCTQHFPLQERAQGIPNHLLAAISSTESGRWHKGLDMPLPWPWTANVEGKGYYFASKAEAVARTQAFMRAGARSIDVGCMQVNLKHHNKAFRDLNEAYDPGRNVAYAAKFLRTNYNDLGDWIKATAAYHSRTPKYGSAYLVRIEKSWNRIVSKVAAARSQQGLAPQTVPTPDFESGKQQAATAAPVRPMNRIDSTRNVRLIQVSNANARRESDVMVVRPVATPTATPVRVADAKAAQASTPDMMVKTEAGVQPVPVAVDSAATKTNSATQKPAGPTFVFAN